MRTHADSSRWAALAGILVLGILIGASASRLPAAYIPPAPDETLAGIQLSLPEGCWLSDLPGAIERVSGRACYVHWQDLIERNSRPTELLPDGVPVQSLAPALRLVSDQLHRSAGNALDARLIHGRIEIATQSYFDRRELMQVSYDLGAYVRARTLSQESRERAARQTMDDVCALLTSAVEPDLWLDNGGDLCQVREVDQTLVVTAPPRVHHHIRWCLKLLSRTPIRDRAASWRSGGCLGS